MKGSIVLAVFCCSVFLTVSSKKIYLEVGMLNFKLFKASQTGTILIAS